MKRKTTEHLAMVSWLLALLCLALGFPAYNASDRIRLALTILGSILCVAGLAAGITAFQQIPYYGKKHIFAHTVLGITLNLLILALMLTFALIVYILP